MPTKAFLQLVMCIACHDYAPFPLSPYPTLFVSTKPIFKMDHEHAAKVARHAPSHQYL